MSKTADRWIATGAILGAAGVGLGAFGAHGLAEALQNRGYDGAELARRLDVFDTAARYHLVHAVAVVLAGLLLQQRLSSAWKFAAAAFFVGILLFSGLLYILTAAGPDWKWLGAVVPLGGLALIAGWIAMAVGALARGKGTN